MNIQAKKKKWSKKEKVKKQITPNENGKKIHGEEEKEMNFFRSACMNEKNMIFAIVLTA